MKTSDLVTEHVKFDVIEYNNRCYKFLINEIIPRANKNNLSIKFIEPKISGFLVMMEMIGRLSRHETRKFLDKVVEHYKK